MQNKSGDISAEAYGIRVEADRLVVYGAIVYDHVVEVTHTGIVAVKHDKNVIDLAAITQVDSSAVSMLLEWTRTAASRQQKITFINLPENLASLVELYGVNDLIPFGCTANPA